MALSNTLDRARARPRRLAAARRRDPHRRRGRRDVAEGAAGRAAGARARACSASTGGAPTPRPRRSSTAGSAPATSPCVEPEGYRLLGRSSVDIIKSGGEKVSALEIEEVFRTHPGVADLAVVGIADDEWGERVCAAVVLARARPTDGECCGRGASSAWPPAKVPDALRARRRPAPQHPRQGRQAEGGATVRASRRTG